MFNKKKKEKDLPLIARVNLAEEMKKRQENMQLGDVSILARADYTKRFPRIRLMYVRFEKFNRYYNEGYRIGTTLGVSSPFMIPKGMSVEGACKIISYLSEKVEKENNIEPASEDSVALVSKLLEEYGFEKLEASYTPGHYHSISEAKAFSKIKTMFDEPIESTYDLITIDGDNRLFKKSVLGTRYFDWFEEGFNKEDIIEVYHDAYLTAPDVLKSKTR